MAELRAAMKALEPSLRVIVCPPHLHDVMEEVAADYPHVEVVSSTCLPAGAVYLIDPDRIVLQ